jgi:hypothetical protein
MDTNILMPGTTLSEGEFITDVSGKWFAGIVQKQFGVYAGTPDNPIGTSITLCHPCSSVEMIGTGLICHSVLDEGEIVWTSPAGTAPCYAIMQADGNLCVYEGDGPANQGPLVFGSKQAGGLDHDFKHYPEYPTTNVHVDMDEVVFENGGQWCIINPDGSEGEYTNGPDMSVSGVLGASCHLRARKIDWAQHFHDSGDNFAIGDQGVTYTLSHDSNPFNSTFFSWDRKK